MSDGAAGDFPVGICWTLFVIEVVDRVSAAEEAG